MKRLWIALFVGGLVWGLQARHSSASQSYLTEGLLHQGDISYQGFFNIPEGPCTLQQGCTANYGGQCLGYDRNGNNGQGSLYMCGIAGTTAMMAEVSIPTGISASHTSISQAPYATRLQGFTNALGGRLDDIRPGDGSLYVGAVLPLANGKMIIGGVDYFGVPLNNKAIAVVSRNITTPQFFSGWHAVSSNGTTNNPGVCSDIYGQVCFGNLVNGGLTPIPASWQTALDGDTLAGQCCETVNPLSSAGPSYTSFWSTDLGVKEPAPGHLVLRYPHGQHASLGDRPDASWTPSPPPAGNPWLYAGNNGLFSVVWPAGTRSVLSFQVVGDGNNYCYGPAVGQKMNNLYAFEAVTRAVSGSNASTNGTGTTIVVPYADLLSNGGQLNHGIWLRNQTLPILVHATHQYQGAALITSIANSGQANATVTVSTPFAANLTGQDFQIGELTCYDPMSRGAELADAPGFHGPRTYPYNYYILAYDASDLVAVKQGAKSVWDPIPYAYWSFNLPLEYPFGKAANKSLGAAAYDPDHRRIYMAQKAAGQWNETVITVWGVNIQNLPPGAPTLCYATMLAVWTGGSLIRRRRSNGSAGSEDPAS